MTRPVRLVSLAAAVALALSTMSAVPVQAADPTGTLRVHLVDAAGKPTSGTVLALVAGDPAGSRTARAITDTDIEVVPGTWGVTGLTGWGGVVCHGVTPCEMGVLTQVIEPTFDPATALTVTAGEVTEVTLRPTAVATVEGTPAIGGLLSVHIPAPVQSMVDGLSSLGWTGSGGLQYQWLRDGEPIQSANAATYVPQLADAGHVVDVLLSYEELLGVFLGPAWIGCDVTPQKLSGFSIPRARSKTFVSLRRNRVTAAQRASVRIDVTSGSVLVPGRIVLTVGKRTWKLTLHNGQARIRLPQLRKGRYAVRAAFPGGAAYQPSVSSKKTLVVKPAPRRAR